MDHCKGFLKCCHLFLSLRRQKKKEPPVALERRLESPDSLEAPGPKGRPWVSVSGGARDCGRLSRGRRQAGQAGQAPSGRRLWVLERPRGFGANGRRIWECLLFVAFAPYFVGGVSQSRTRLFGWFFGGEKESQPTSRGLMPCRISARASCINVNGRG